MQKAIETEQRGKIYIWTNERVPKRERENKSL